MVHSLNSSIVFGTGLDQQVKQLARIAAPYRYQVVRKHSSTAVSYTHLTLPTTPYV